MTAEETRETATEEAAPAPPPETALAAIDRLERKDDLVALARGVLARMHESKRTAPDRAATEAQASDLGLERAACATPFGDALDVLSRGPEDDAERKLAGALALAAAALGDPNDDGADRAAVQLVWLAAHTPFDALLSLDELPPAKRPWRAIAEAARGPSLDRAERLVAWAALARSGDEVARRAVKSANDPLLEGLSAAPPPPLSFTGEAAAAPRSAWATALLGLTGLLLLGALARLLLRHVLSFKRPATVEIGAAAVTVRYRTELLGRTVRDREIVYPREGLISAAREVRFPSVQLYAGLLALALGSFLGVSLVVDGLRASSTSLLGAGALIVAAGVALDLALVSALPGARGTTRVIFRARRGALAIERADPKRADAALARLKN